MHLKMHITTTIKIKFALEIDLISGSGQDPSIHIFDRDDYSASGDDKTYVLKYTGMLSRNSFEFCKLKSFTNVILINGLIFFYNFYV